MKKIAFILSMLAVVSTVTIAQTYKVETEKSTINWLAKKVTGQHQGTVSISSGQLEFKNKVLSGGTFVVNMGSIVCTDISDADMNAKLIGHLKSEDFFSVVAFPQANLVITNVTKKDKVTYQIKAKLTIKGTTEIIEFPATVSINDGQVVASANIKVDRTKYNVKYGSNKFFQSLGDKAINDEFELLVKLIGSK